jgi:hypothetical protein
MVCDLRRKISILLIIDFLTLKRPLLELIWLLDGLKDISNWAAKWPEISNLVSVLLDYFEDINSHLSNKMLAKCQLGPGIHY